MLEKDQFPSDSEIYQKIKDITLGLDAVYVSACWKMAGLAKMDNSEDESSQVKLFYFQEYPTRTLVGCNFPRSLKLTSDFTGSDITKSRLKPTRKIRAHEGSNGIYINGLYAMTWWAQY